ncbi:MAG TPA: glycosyltransferase [Anaerolineales bacterium]|nr:glycosyltransferase [Anaerolineales bacterium]
MHITILALGSRGDVQPYATLGRGLKAAGHQVRFITFESFASLIAEHELDFHPIHGDAQALVASGGADMLGLIRSFGSLAEGYARDLSAPYLGETDLIVNQLPLGLYGFDLAEKHGIPMILAAVIPVVRTRAFPLMGLPKIPLPGYNKFTYYLGEQMGWQMFRGVINRWRKQKLNLPPLPLRGYFELLATHKIPILNGFSRYVVPRPADWNEHIHVTGYWFPEDKPWQPPQDLQEFIEAGSPPIFIGFGSMPVKDPQKTTEIILEALKPSGQRGILHMGWGGIGNQNLPDYVFKINYAPYEWLFPRMAMVIHHGGSGTTSFGLRAGIPSCIVPFVFDQFFWGKRIVELGVGPGPIPYKALTAERLRDAILAGNDSLMRQRAFELGLKIQAENGLENGIQVIEQVLQERKVLVD